MSFELAEFELDEEEDEELLLFGLGCFRFLLSLLDPAAAAAGAAAAGAVVASLAEVVTVSSVSDFEASDLLLLAAAGVGAGRIPASTRMSLS